MSSGCLAPALLRLILPVSIVTLRRAPDPALTCCQSTEEASDDACIGCCSVTPQYGSNTVKEQWLTLHKVWLCHVITVLTRGRCSRRTRCRRARFWCGRASRPASRTSCAWRTSACSRLAASAARLLHICITGDWQGQLRQGGDGAQERHGRRVRHQDHQEGAHSEARRHVLCQHASG